MLEHRPTLLPSVLANFWSRCGSGDSLAFLVRCCVILGGQDLAQPFPAHADPAAVAGGEVGAHQPYRHERLSGREVFSDADDVFDDDDDDGDGDDG